MRISIFLLFQIVAPILLAQGPPPARVVIAEVEERELSPTSRMVGVLRFIRVSEVGAEVEGLIAEHNFDTGWELKKGAVLAALNSDFIRKDMQILRSEVAELEADIEKQAREVKRQERLKRDKVGSRSAYDEAFFTHKSLVERKGTLKRRLERLQLSLNKSRVRAPFDGVVLEKLKELGDWVNKGEPLARLGGADGVQAVIPISELLLPYQKTGVEFEVSIPALGRTIKGKLSGVAPFAEVRSKSVYLKIKLPYETGMIENLSAEAEVPTAAPKRLRLIPRAALLQQPGMEMVYTVNDGKAAPLPVNIVTRSGGFIAVDSPNITPGMAVVVDGNDRLRPGQPVQVVNGSAGAAQ